MEIERAKTENISWSENEKSADSSTGWPDGPAGSDGSGRDRRGRFVAGDDRARFLGLVAVADLEELAGLGHCWLWTGRKTEDGYPLLDIAGRPVRAHRWAWEHHYGLVLPARWTLDHLCHTFSVDCPGGAGCWHTLCVRPNHLEPLPPGGNLARRHARDRALAAIRAEAP